MVDNTKYWNQKEIQLINSDTAEVPSFIDCENEPLDICDFCHDAKTVSIKAGHYMIMKPCPFCN